MIESPHATEALEWIVETAEDAQSNHRTHAIMLAGGLSPVGAPAVPAMIAALSSPDSTVVRITATSLGRLGITARPALDALRAAAARADWSARPALRDAITSIEAAAADADTATGRSED